MFTSIADRLLPLLADWDTTAFLLLNGLHSPSWDSVMAQVSSPWVLIPVHVLLLAALVRRSDWRRSAALFAVLLLVIFVDLAGTHVIKDSVQRVRPCNEDGLASSIHFVGGRRSGAFSFVSTHTSYAFAVAGFAWFSLARHRLALGLGGWAAAVGYSRIYLGLHYPGDILGAALWGVSSAAALHGGVVLARHLPWPGARWPETSAANTAPAHLSTHP